MECRAYAICLDSQSRGHLGKDRKVSPAAGGNLSRKHKTEKTAKESRLNLVYSYLNDRTLAGPKGRALRAVGLTLNTHQVVAWFFPTDIRPKLKRRPMPFRFRVFADLLSKCATFGHRVACLSEAPSGLDAFKSPSPG